MSNAQPSARRKSRFGSWHSPITAWLAARQSIRFGDIVVDENDVYWVESRPAERGRSVIVLHTPEGTTADVTDVPFSARSRVHEYGGGAFNVRNGVVYFVNFDDQRIYRKDLAGVVLPVTYENGNRYADLIIDDQRSRIICIQEAHQAAVKEPVNTIVAVSTTKLTEPRTLIKGNDFYSSPRMSPNGRYLAWLAWNHPNMPWDGTELWVSEIDRAGAVMNPHKIAGGVSESIFQPEWSPDNMLYFTSDKTGWWNIYRYTEDVVESLFEFEAEFALPQWNFGLSTYGFISCNRLACTFNQRGIWQLATIDINTRKMHRLQSAYSDIAHLKTMKESIVFYGGSPTEALSVVRHDTSSDQAFIIRRSEESSVDPGYISRPELIEFDTSGSRKAYGFFYSPQNKDYTEPLGERPPLIVVTHGGPTSCSYASLDLKIQFWTSRGFAVLDVNYGGSTGFGRPYRDRLKGNWGIVDVDDCVSGAEYLIKKNMVDVEKLIIRGGSAGGYTTLAALTFRDLFKAGASYYGVSDLESLTKETHKFESRYLDGLVGPYPEAESEYHKRSPINYPELLSTPVIFFQGLDDKVVPPNQAEKMVNALREKKIPVAYIAFAGEQHGFRKAENLKRTLEAELYFYSRVLGFDLTDDIAPVEIENI
jgi:dipeptidyl aminopeptidase/acylaminoacyl peptidase